MQKNRKRKSPVSNVYSENSDDNISALSQKKRTL